MSGFVIGQRWISESEPELGLATVVHTEKGRVVVEFKSAGETRTYATEHDGPIGAGGGGGLGYARGG